MEENQIEYIKHTHLRMSSGIEVLSVLVSVDDELLLYRPARIEYGTQGIRLAPMSIFSDAEFFAIKYSDIEFQCTMNEDTKAKYEEFYEEFSKHVNSEVTSKTLH